ncbi:MAG TPA: hypothetical protein VFK11_00865 [Candidatus Saccharimonadales bacterium]|nr:hypothetical protein [Candidatus Saccharimonadales bacterium]
MKLFQNQKGFGAIEGLLILIIVGLIGGVGYYVYSANKEEVKISDTSIQPRGTKNTLPVAVAEKNKGWQVYNSPDADFFIEYPAEWNYLAKGTVIDGGENATNEFIPAKEFKKNDNSKALFFSVHKTELNLKQYVSKYGAIFDGSEGNSKLISSKSSTINGHSAHTVIGEVYGGVNYFVYVEGKGKVIEFQYLDNAEYLDTYKKIVDSTQFQN